MTRNIILSIILLLILVFTSSLVMAENDKYVGNWKGGINIQGTQLGVILHLEESADELAGTIDIPAQGAMGIPLSDLKVNGQNITFKMANIPGDPTFTGQIKGQIIEGTFTQNGQQFLFTLERESEASAEESQNFEPVLGTWVGQLKYSGTEMDIVLHIDQTSDGKLDASMDSPHQGVTDIFVNKVDVDGNQVVIQSNMIGVTFEGQIEENGQKMVGDWKQNGVVIPITFKLQDKYSGLNRPQTPEKPYPYEEVEVTYQNQEDEITLAGTLSIPQGQGPFPAVLLITGSGAQDRDETLFGHKPFLVISDYLTRRGIAVLRVDDRGVGGSTGSPDATSADFAQDVRAGVKFLKSRSEVDSNQIGLVGHSEGGIIAPMVAADSDDVAYIVLMAGPGIPGEELSILQGQLIAESQGISAEEIADNAELQKKLFAIIREEKNKEVQKKKMRQVLENSFENMTPEQKEGMSQKDIDDLIDSQINRLTSKWIPFYINYDPRPTLKKVDCPVLAMNGSKDIQVPADVNLEAIEKALQEGGNSNYKIVKLEGLNHLFQTCQTGAMSEYGTIEETFSPKALKVIGDWILEQTK